MPYYYEVHITIEPVFDDRLDQLKEISKLYKFRVADLLFKKNRRRMLERSNLDSFCTGRFSDPIIAKNQIIEFVKELKASGFKVWRYKIEEVTVDSQISDIYKIL